MPNSPKGRSLACGIYFYRLLWKMRAFSNDLSPINHKRRGKEPFCEEITQRWEGDPSQPSHFYDPIPASSSLLEQRICSTAKTLTYLFSNEIDLIQTLEHNIQNYDKYQKARLILRELLAVHDHHPLSAEVARTSQEIAKLETEIEDLSGAFGVLQRENRQKDEEIVRYKKSIMDLSRAYEQAKTCFSDEILEQKYEIEELKRTLDAAVGQKSRSKSKNKKVTLLDIPQHRTTKDSEAYTDRSIYKRFTASQMQEEKAGQKYNREQQSHQGHTPPHPHPHGHISYSQHYHVMETYQFEKDKLQRRIFDLEAKVAKLEEEMKNAKKEGGEAMQLLRNRVTSLEAELNDKSRKLKEKNKTITQLLNSLQFKSTQA